jgi:3-hydroxyisobutyrate dehydrogenase-like beta-hydroxyacid dehydrogenase
MGPTGSGHLAKLCNQVLTGVGYAAVAEALVLGAKGGLDPAQLLEVLSTSSGRSRTLEQAGPAILARAFDAAFTADLAAKDLECALAAARALTVRLLLASTAHQCYVEMRGLGLGHLDQAAVVIPAERIAGISVGARPA